MAIAYLKQLVMDHDGVIYIYKSGNTAVTDNGNWKMCREGDDLKFYYRTGDAWVEKMRVES